jgi:hypothetical protein
VEIEGKDYGKRSGTDRIFTEPRNDQCYFTLFLGTVLEVCVAILEFHLEFLELRKFLTGRLRITRTVVMVDGALTTWLRGPENNPPYLLHFS